MSPWISRYRSSILFRPPSLCLTILRINTSKHIINKHCHISDIARIQASPTSWRLFRDALFISAPEISTVNKHELLRDLHQPRSQELAPDFVPSERIIENLKALREAGTTGKDVLFLLNAFIHRCEHSSRGISLRLLHYGLEVAAACNSPIAIYYYLQKINLRIHLGQRRALTPRIDLKQWASFTHCIPAKKHVGIKDWKSKRRQEAWATLIMGLGSDEIKKGERTQACLYHAFIQFGEKGLYHYFKLVRKFCSSKSILESWQVTRDLHEKKGILNSDVSSFILNASIRILIKRGDLERAWEIASTPGSGKITDPTWRALFRHPEYLPAWNSDFERPAMAALEEYAKKIESRLGVIWTGGENGVHEPKIEGIWSDY